MIRFFLIIVLFMSGWQEALHAQVQVQPQPEDTSAPKWVQIINANRYGYKRIDSVTEIQIMAGNVQLKQDNTTFYCDSAILNKSLKTVEAFGNVHINDNDSVHTYSQYLLYHSDTKIAHLNKKVRLTDSKSTLLTEELQYDLNQKIGEYVNGGKVINGESVLTSKEATYYADLKDVYFKHNVVLIDPKYSLRSDSLLYNTKTQVATFIALTHIQDSARRTITTREGFYDMPNRKAYLTSRSVVEDGAVRIVADSIQTDDSTGLNILRGNAVYVDTAQGVSVLANAMDANRKEGSFLATQRPLMIIKQDKDSIYVTADTLFSGRLSKMGLATDTVSVLDSFSVAKNDTIRKVALADSSAAENDSTDRYFKAWYHVRIFSDSLQALSDSLFYSGKDSAFRLFKDPIAWVSGNQVTGDTIYLFTKNKKADSLYVAEHGMVVNKAGENMFNQVSGNRLYGFFLDGSMDRMRARGAAQSVYYVKDDNNYLVGVNRAAGDVIEMRFKDKELNRVVFINQVTGTLYPVNGIADQEKLLKNFHWYEEKRPKNKFELFGN